MHHSIFHEFFFVQIVAFQSGKLRNGTLLIELIWFLMIIMNQQLIYNNHLHNNYIILCIISHLYTTKD